MCQNNFYVDFFLFWKFAYNIGPLLKGAPLDCPVSALRGVSQEYPKRNPSGWGYAAGTQGVRENAGGALGVRWEYAGGKIAARSR